MIATRCPDSAPYEFAWGSGGLSEPGRGDCTDGELPLQESNLDYLIQSPPVGACLEDTMSASGDLPSIGAPTVGGKCPHRS